LKTGDQILVKKINKSIVLQTIQTNSPISRAEISKSTGLNKATVSTLVSEIMDDHLVTEIGTGTSSGGRKPVMLYFNQTAGYSIGIDLGVNYILAILTDLKGVIIAKKEVKVTDTSILNIYSILKSIITYFLEIAPESPYGVVGIGIGVPGMTNKKGTIIFAPYLDWRDVDLKGYIEEEFHLPVIIENEAKAGAHGEKIYGVGQKVSNFVYISIGMGIGGGFIIDNKLFQGKDGLAGEIGHSIIDANGKKCNCGNRGCWEMYGSENALLKQATSLESFKGKEISLELIIHEAEKGNPEVINLLHNIGEFIGIGLTTIMNTFNPDQVIIGNRFSKLENWIANSIRRTLQQRLYPYFYESLDLSFSKLGVLSCALGSSAFTIENFFASQKVTVI
jgi:predicted NBD/HSP70 family sugar kinase